MSLTKVVGGEIRRYKGGSFLYVERGLEDINAEGVKRYLAEHRSAINLDAIRQRFPELKKTRKESMLFFDVETCGLGYTSPIFAIGMTHLNHHITTNCLVARDYSEERTILQYFLDHLHNYEKFFTYNGTAFDLTRLDKRMKANALRVDDSRKTLKEVLGGSHIDLKRELDPKALRTGNLRLQTIEKIVFGMSRDKDIPSKDIPAVYHAYVNGADNQDKIAQSINHVMRDTLTLVAILALLCS